MMGIVVELAVRPNRYFCLPIAWRVYEKRGTKTKQEHQTKCQLALELIVLVSRWFPQRRQFLVVADGAYIGKATIERPS